MHHNHSPLERIAANHKFMSSRPFMQPVIHYQSCQVNHEKNISEQEDFQVFFDALIVPPVTDQSKENDNEYKVNE